MSAAPLDPVFASALRERLVALARDGRSLRRRWSWRLGAGTLAGSVALAGGVAFAAGVFSPPGAPHDTPTAGVVAVTRTGTATVELGSAPPGTTNISLTLTCLSTGTFGYPDGSWMSCSPADLAHPPPGDRTSTEVVPLHPGVHSVTITANPKSSWTLEALYINRVITPWGRNSHGETYGQANVNGRPDLVQVVFRAGSQQGYVKASDLDCASGRSEIHTPADAVAWTAASKTRDVSVPIYTSDGRTVIGAMTSGSASGPGTYTVSVATLYPLCAPSSPRVGSVTAVTVPALLGRPLASAEKTLKQVGLDYQVMSVPNTAPPGTVVSQQPAAGSNVDSGSIVSIAVSTNPSVPSPTTTYGGPA